LEKYQKSFWNYLMCCFSGLKNYRICLIICFVSQNLLVQFVSWKAKSDWFWKYSVVNSPLKNTLHHETNLSDLLDVMFCFNSVQGISICFRWSLLFTNWRPTFPPKKKHTVPPPKKIQFQRKTSALYYTRLLFLPPLPS
jgi:hypothetical protein